jgi:hypothetical protein
VMADVMLGVVIGFVAGWVLGWIGGRLTGLGEGAHRERVRSREAALPVGGARGLAVDLDEDSMAGWSDPQPRRTGRASNLVRKSTDTHCSSDVVGSTAVVMADVGGSLAGGER